jgi:zinc protease
MRQALFPQHPYALRSNGSVEAVQHLTQKDLADFRDRYVVAKNGVIYVFGDVKAAEVKQLVEQTLGNMQPGVLALTDAKPSMPLSKSETVESRKDKAQGVLMVGFRGASLSSPDRYALELIDEASSDLGSRFFIRIREKMGLAYYVGAAQMQGLVPGLFSFYLGTDPQKLERVKTEFLDEIHKLANEGLTAVELQRAKKKLIGQQEIANQSNDAFGYHCALDELYGLGFDYYKRLEHDVNAVTLDDIKKVATKYFRDQPYVLATVQPPASANATAGKPESSPAAKQKYQGTAVSSPPPKTQRKR